MRSPSSPPSQLDRYSVDPWPQWPVPPEYLTPHGYKLLKQFGAWDRAWLEHAGLLASAQCNAAAIYIETDSDERTIASGHALAEGLSPDCPVTVQSLAQGTHYSLFHPSHLNLDAATRAEAVKAVRQVLPAGPKDLTAMYRGQLALLQHVLDGCMPNEPCIANKKTPAVSLMSVPAVFESGHGHKMFTLTDPVSTGASLAEDMLLEYVQGMPYADVAWGQLDEARLRDLIGLHTAEFAIAHRTPFLAQMQASNLLDHMLRTLQQAASGTPVPGALGQPGQRLVVLDGHDTNIASVAGLLHLHWTLDGRTDDTPPGMQIQFLLYRDTHGRASVQVHVAMQTLDQMRNATPLTVANPPALAVVNLPECDARHDTCPWITFEQIAARAIDSRFVLPLKQ